MDIQYPDLQINGKLFQNWMVKNFTDLQIPEHIHNPNVCEDNKKLKKALRKSQELPAKYMNYKSPYTSLLLFHGLGSGKTIGAVNLIRTLYNITPEWNFFVLIKASLRADPWEKELKAWLGDDNYADKYSRILFINYDSPFADRNFLDAKKQSKPQYKNVYIIEEAHNFIKNVYNNMSQKGGKRAKIIYDIIYQEKIENDNTRIMLLSGTPAINSPFEFALLFNLLRPGSFPNNETTFSDMYISHIGAKQILNPQKKNLFQRRIIGLVSYYVGSDPNTFPKRHNHVKYIKMSDHQKGVYEYYEHLELEKLKKSKFMAKSYYTYSRQANNFVFPYISKQINGESRPRPKNVSGKDIEDIESGKTTINDKDLTESQLMLKTYIDNINTFKNALITHFNKLNESDKVNKHTILDDIESFKVIKNFPDFLNDKSKKSSLFQEMYNCSAKMTLLIFLIFAMEGSGLIFSNYVKLEGLEIMAIYLSMVGFKSFGESSSKDYFRYMEFSGSIEFAERKKHKDIFNDIENSDGKLIRLILLGPAGAEGLSFFNIRHVHILDPFWHNVRIDQVIGRAIRYCSHSSLSPDKRNVDVIYYRTILNQKKTIDDTICEIADEKTELIKSFEDTIKEAAIDCKLFKNDNMAEKEYMCFQFDEENILDKHIGPAFNIDIHYDMNMDDGLNSGNTVVENTTVYKISAFDPETSETSQYWLNVDTNIIYDLIYEIPIGIIKIDNDSGNPDKYDANTYIIDKLVRL